MATPEITPPKPHPIEALIQKILASLGRGISLVLGLFLLFCLCLLIDSANQIDGSTGFIILLIAFGSYGLAAYTAYIAQQRGINLIVGREKVTLNTLNICNVLLIFYGFIQTFFWVIDPYKPIHEPRAVFMLTIAGVFAFLSSQYQKVRGKQ